MDPNTPLDNLGIDPPDLPTGASGMPPTDLSGASSTNLPPDSSAGDIAVPNQSTPGAPPASSTPPSPKSLADMDWAEVASEPEPEVPAMPPARTPTNEPDVMPSANQPIQVNPASGPGANSTTSPSIVPPTSNNQAQPAYVRLASLPPEPTPQSPPPPPPPQAVVQPEGSSSSKKPIIIVVIVVLVLALLGGGAWLFIQSRKKPVVVQATPTPTAIPSATSDISSAYDRIVSYNIDDFSASNKQKLVDKYNDLAHDFELEPNSFDNTTTLLALGVASLYDKDPTNKERYRTELYLLLSWHLKSLPTGITDDTFDPPGNGADILKTLRSFKDDNLTQQVMSSMGLQKALNNAVSALKLKSQTDLSPYEIIAFNFDTDGKKFDELTAKYPLYGARPKMWTAGIDGKEYIMMFKSFAQEVIDDKPNSLAHEFIHAQSAFVEGETGRMVEERRAELFSGDKSSYFDAKQLFIYAGVFSGTDFLDLLQQHPTSSADFYADVYKKIGVTGTNALAFSWPNAYAGASSKAMQSIYQLDLQDVVMKETLKLGQKDSASLKDRTESRYQTLMKVFGNDKTRVINDLKNNLSDSYGMASAAQYMIEFVNSHS